MKQTFLVPGDLLSDAEGSFSVFKITEMTVYYRPPGAGWRPVAREKSEDQSLPGAGAGRARGEAFVGVAFPVAPWLQCRGRGCKDPKASSVPRCVRCGAGRARWCRACVLGRTRPFILPSFGEPPRHSRAGKAQTRVSVSSQSLSTAWTGFSGQGLEEQ